MIETDIDPQTHGGEPKYLPSPEEIRRMYELIRSEWDRETELSRRVIRPSRELDYGRPARIGTNYFFDKSVNLRPPRAFARGCSRRRDGTERR